MNTAYHMINRTGSSPVAGKPLIELWLNTGPLPIHHFRVFCDHYFSTYPKRKEGSGLLRLRKETWLDIVKKEMGIIF